MQLQFWYGSHQHVGHLGHPQRFFNLLGTAKGVTSLAYRLNDAKPHDLNLGKDHFRLLGAGDFNAEIAFESLREGDNKVVFTALHEGQCLCKVLSLSYTAGRTWALPYNVSWSQIAAAAEAVQIVDGRWHLSRKGLRTAASGYDRLITLGDMRWQDYQITVQATIHDFFIAPDHPWADGGLMGGLGVLFRWSGHRPDAHSPYREWRPNGAIGWYRARWEEKPAQVRCLNISDAVVQDRLMVETEPLELLLNQPYTFQFAVQTQAAGTSLYRYRVWPTHHPERQLCDLSCRGNEGEAAQGSILLVCLFADVTVGNIAVEALGKGAR